MSNIYKISTWLCLILLGLSIQIQSMAQNSDKVRSLKTNYVLQQLELTKSEQESFLPLYNNYQDELDNIRKKFPTASATDKISRQEEELQLNKNFITKFKGIMSVDKVNKIFEAESDFNRKLIEELDKRNHN
jgi:Skp family chaperone for outer membrane proteins